MKHTLALTLAILLLAATGWGQSQTNQIALRLEKMESAVIWTNAPYNRIGTNTSYGVVLHVPTTEETVRKLAASGEICKALGRHFWRPGRPGEGEGSSYGGWYADYHPGTTYRTCAICGKCESKTEGEWK